jgi:aryl-alcohol dehydrogenase-like predicted oxidoreductase
MNTIRFGRTGVEVSPIALGTWSFGGPKKAGRRDVGWGGHEDATAIAALARAYELGIRHWDTADAYGDGHAEELIGRVLGEVDREKVFLASKVGWVQGPFPHFYHPDLIRRQLERSLINLRTDHIDLYYLHHCDFGPDDRYLEPALDLFARFREEGKIRFVGLSDWDAAKILRLAPRVDPDVVQPYRNLLDDQYTSSGLAAWVKEHDLGVAFFSPLKHGLLLGKYLQVQEFEPGDMRRGIPGFSDPSELERLARVRADVEQRIEHPEPILHAVIDTLLQDSPTASVLLGQRNVLQVEAASTLGVPPDPETAAWIRSLYSS